MEAISKKDLLYLIYSQAWVSVRRWYIWLQDNIKKRNRFHRSNKEWNCSVWNGSVFKRILEPYGRRFKQIAGIYRIRENFTEENSAICQVLPHCEILKIIRQYLLRIHKYHDILELVNGYWTVSHNVQKWIIRIRSWNNKNSIMHS